MKIPGFPKKISKYGLTLLMGISLPFGIAACLIDQVGGAFSHKPEELREGASVGARRLIEQAFEGITPKLLIDYHVHVAGIGTNNSGAFVNSNTQSWLNLRERLKFEIYASAAGIENFENADEEYIDRLVQLIQNIKEHGKFHILAFDKYYHSDGKEDIEKTTFYIPNEYVFQLAQEYPDLFLPVISVHPYRSDALEELEKWAKKGARYIKWLPNAMGIDPSSSRIDPFYRKMREYNMVLLSHAGEEQAVEAEADQRLGNPLLLRKPLGYGIRVIMAHCASLGMCEDLDSPQRAKLSCFNLFLRLMDDEKYEGLLFGDISGQVNFNRMAIPISTILKREDLHHRLVNGSDYPLPAINFLIQTSKLLKGGFITEEEREHLNEIYDYNPLLFDFVLKRTIRHPETGQKLSSSVFLENPGLKK